MRITGKVKFWNAYWWASMDCGAGAPLLARSAAILATLFVMNTAASAADTRHEVNPQSMLETWESKDHGVFLSLTQIKPDQARAFFLARGFDRKSVDEYASTCVFQTIFRNESVPAAVSTALDDWRISTPKGEQGLKLEADWERQWEANQVPESARIAFRWSQFPMEQSFEPGDWNQGMTTYKLPMGSKFDLKFRWKIKGVLHESLLAGVRCATDKDARQVIGERANLPYPVHK